MESETAVPAAAADPRGGDGGGGDDRSGTPSAGLFRPHLHAETVAARTRRAGDQSEGSETAHGRSLCAYPSPQVKSAAPRREQEGDRDLGLFPRGGPREGPGRTS